MAEAIERRRAKIGPKIAAANEVTIAQIGDQLTPAWKAAPNWDLKKRYLREVVAYYGADMPITSISESRHADLQHHLLTTPVRIWTGGNRSGSDPDAADYTKVRTEGRSNATVNKFLPIARAIFRRAHQQRDPRTGKRLIDAVPTFPALKEAKRLPRPVPQNVIGDVLGRLSPYVREALIGSLHFGFRTGEMFGLRIEHVGFEQGGVRLLWNEQKGGDDTFIPGSTEAMEFLRGLVDQAEARRTRFLITWRGPGNHRDAPDESTVWRPLKSARDSWNRVMDELAAVYGQRWRWHDLRATFITAVGHKDGVLVAQKMARHKSLTTTMRYMGVCDEQLRAAANGVADMPALRAASPKSPTKESHQIDGPVLQFRRKA